MAITVSVINPTKGVYADNSKGYMENLISIQKEKNAEKMSSAIKEKDYDYDSSISSLMESEKVLDDWDTSDVTELYEILNGYRTSQGLSGYSETPFLEIGIRESVNEGGQSENKLTANAVFPKMTSLDICEQSGTDVAGLISYIDSNSTGYRLSPSQPVETDSEAIARALAVSDNSILVNNLIMVAKGSIGQILYTEDSMIPCYGNSNEWWTFSSNGKRQGLDSFGYMQWVYKNAGFSPEFYELICETTDFENSESFKHIKKRKLKIGDLGINDNEIGLFIGNDKWVTMTKKTGVPAVTDGNEFEDYYRPLYEGYKKEIIKPEIKYIERIIKETPSGNIVVSENSVSSDSVSLNSVSDNILTYNPMTLMVMEGNGLTPEEMDLELLARITQAEAGGEGLNGWVAVAEVVLNRVNSPSYPNDIYGVISAPSQFEGFHKAMAYPAANPEIKEVCRQVMQGRMGILNNPYCLYFQNPSITGYGWNEFNGRPLYTVIGNHHFYA